MTPSSLSRRVDVSLAPRRPAISALDRLCFRRLVLNPSGLAAGPSTTVLTWTNGLTTISPEGGP